MMLIDVLYVEGLQLLRSYLAEAMMKTLKSRNQSGEVLTDDLYFRIIPKSLRILDAGVLRQNSKWVFYLEKGMQTFGKTSPITLSQEKVKGSLLTIAPNSNKFDFQIVNDRDKNLIYGWGLYKILDNDLQQRVECRPFSIKQSFKRYNENKNKFPTFTITSSFTFIKVQLDFVLFIQNNQANIVKLTKLLLPDHQEEQGGGNQSAGVLDAPDQQEIIYEVNVKDVKQPNIEMENNGEYLCCVDIQDEFPSLEFPPIKEQAKEENYTLRIKQELEEKMNEKKQVLLQSNSSEEKRKNKEDESLTLTHKISIEANLGSDSNMVIEELEEELLETEKNEVIECENEFQEIKLEQSINVSGAVQEDDGGNADQFERVLKKIEQRQKFKKAALILVMILLIVGLLGYTIMPKQKTRVKASRKSSKK